MERQMEHQRFRVNQKTVVPVRDRSISVSVFADRMFRLVFMMWIQSDHNVIRLRIDKIVVSSSISQTKRLFLITILHIRCYVVIYLDR